MIETNTVKNHFWFNFICSPLLHSSYCQFKSHLIEFNVLRNTKWRGQREKGLAGILPRASMQLFSAKLSEYAVKISCHLISEGLTLISKFPKCQCSFIQKYNNWLYQHMLFITYKTYNIFGVCINLIQLLVPL